MRDCDPVIDEQTLASFLGGTLPESRRAEVISQLAADYDARELLQMARQALRAAEIEDGLPEPASRPAIERARPDRAAVRKVRLFGVRKRVLLGLVAVAIGVIVLLSVNPSIDTLRSPLLQNAESLNVLVTAPGPGFTWAPVDEAFRYRLVVWDPGEARVVGRYETRESWINGSDEMMQDLRTRLRRDASYELRVDAIDAQNRLIRSSDTVVFVAE